MHSINVHQYQILTQAQSRIIVTEDKLGHWDTGNYDIPPKSSKDMTHTQQASTYQLRFDIYVVVVNDRYIPASVMNRHIPYRLWLFD